MTSQEWHQQMVAARRAYMAEVAAGDAVLDWDAWRVTKGYIVDGQKGAYPCTPAVAARLKADPARHRQPDQPPSIVVPEPEPEAAPSAPSVLPVGPDAQERRRLRLARRARVQPPKETPPDADPGRDHDA